MRKTIVAIGTAAIAAALIFPAGCGSKEDPAEYARREMEKQRGPRPPSVITEIKVPVPEGKKVPCANWVDVEKFKLALEDEVSLKDKSGSEVEATSICALIRGGEAVNAEAQEKKWMETNQVLGVLPGDEYCMASLYCSYVAEVNDLKKQCERQQDEGNDVLGVYSCVHRTQRAANWAYTYKTIDPETKCSVVVRGGPSVTDEPIVQKCASAALDSLTPAGIAEYM